MENVNVPKQRHGCVTTWLLLIIITNSILAFLSLFLSEYMAEEILTGAPPSLLILIGIISLANVVFAVLLFRWMILGFWGFLGTSIIGVILNLAMGVGIGQSLFGLAGVYILYRILQIKKDNVSTWDHLSAGAESFLAENATVASSIPPEHLQRAMELIEQGMDKKSVFQTLESEGLKREEISEAYGKAFHLYLKKQEE